VDDPFALEEGPLEPIDESIDWFPARAGPTMESVVAGELAALNGTDPALDQVALTVGRFDASGAAGAIDDPTLDDAIGSHEETRAALENDSPGVLVETSDGHLTLIDTRSGDYDFDLPGYIDEPAVPGRPDEPKKPEPKIPDEPK
jgi:hypothetical protein